MVTKIQDPKSLRFYPPQVKSFLKIKPLCTFSTWTSFQFWKWSFLWLWYWNMLKNVHLVCVRWRKIKKTPTPGRTTSFKFSIPCSASSPSPIPPFWSKIWYGFRGNYSSVWTYLSLQFQMNKKERVVQYSKWIILKKSFVGFLYKVMMTQFLRGQVWKWVWKWHFLVCDMVRSGELGGIPPPGVPRRTPFPWAVTLGSSPCRLP